MLNRHDADLIKKSSELKDKTELKEKRQEQKQELREKFPLLVENIIQSKIGSTIVDEIVVDITESWKTKFLLYRPVINMMNFFILVWEKN